MKRLLLSSALVLISILSYADTNKAIADRMFPVGKCEAPQSKIKLLEDYSHGCAKLGRHCQGRIAVIDGVSYTDAIGVNSPSRIRLSLDKPAKRITGRYGLDDGVNGTPASVEFVLESQGKCLMKSPVVFPGAKAQDFDVDLGGSTQVDLVVTEAGDGPGFDQGIWADLKVHYTDGTQESVCDMAQALPSVGVPFSFEYAGVNSSEFISSWDYEASDEIKEDRILRTATYKDTYSGLEIKAVVNIYTKAPGIDYTLYLKNCGKENSPIISNLKALDIIVPPTDFDRSETKYCNPTYVEPQHYSQGVAPVLHRLNGTDGYMYFCMNDFMPITDVLSEGNKVDFGPYDSYSSSGAFPFYDITYTGGGFVTAVGWTGKWNSLVEISDGAIHSTSQMSDLNTFLYPQEEIRSPRIMLVFWQRNDRMEGLNQFRKTMMTYISPRYNGELQRVPCAHMTSCQHQDNTTTADNEKSYIDTIKKHNLAFEVYWLDAWWHKGGFPAGLGNYLYPLETAIDEERFPNGVKDVSDYAKSLGLKFLCWFAPETLSEGSKLAMAHPEWILPQGAPSGNLNLGNKEALEYTIKYMDDCIKAWGVDIWRTDIGYTLSGIKEMEKSTPDRVGILEIRQVEGLYKLWDAIREHNPGLMIDNCCGGGSRIDLETSSRSISLWRTDSGVWAGGSGNKKDLAILNQNNNVCLNPYIIQSSCAVMGNKPYYMRSGFNNGMIFDDDNRSGSYDNDLLREGLLEAKRLRKYFYGDFYPIIFRSTSYEEWCAYQYNRPEEGDGVVIAFRRDESPIITAELCLKGLDPDARYSVDIYGESFEKQKTIKIKGKDLMSFPLTIDCRPGSAIVEYRKL